MSIDLIFGRLEERICIIGIYLLLRQDVDSTEWDEIYDSSEAGLVYGLPKLTTDESGLPVVLSTTNSETDAG